MLKLMKYELKEAMHSLLPIGLGTMILSLLSALLTALTLNHLESSALSIFTILTGLIGFLTFLSFVAVVIICFVSNVGRFFHMLGQQGYLELTLPVTLGKQIAAKLFSALITTVLTIVFLCLCGCVLILPSQPANWFSAMLGEGLNLFHKMPLGCILFGILILVAGMAGVYLHTYLSCAIGGFFPQQRKLASIITFFVLQLAMQVLFVLFVSFSFTHFETLIDMLGRFAFNTLSRPNGEWKFIYGALFGITAIQVLIDAVFWLLTQTILTKKLNLP